MWTPPPISYTGVGGIQLYIPNSVMGLFKAILLQEMEGYFYNGVIAPVLQDRFPGGDWFIVYDAVFASSAISEEVQSLLNELCLGHFGVEGLFSL